MVRINDTTIKILILIINVIMFVVWFGYFAFISGKTVMKYIKDSDILFYFMSKLSVFIIVFVHTVWTIGQGKPFIARLTPYWCLSLFLFFISTIMASFRIEQISSDKKDKKQLKSLFILDLFYCIFLFLQLLVILLTSIELKTGRDMDELLKFPEQSKGLVNFINKKVLSEDFPENKEYVMKDRTEGEGTFYVGLLKEK